MWCVLYKVTVNCNLVLMRLEANFRVCVQPTCSGSGRFLFSCTLCWLDVKCTKLSLYYSIDYFDAIFYQFVDLATIDILRDRERGVPRYNQFRRLLNLTAPDTFEKLTNDTVTAAELREAYSGNIEDVDLLIGSLAEARPEGFGFGDTPFHLFLCMANRRLKTDRCVVHN